MPPYTCSRIQGDRQPAYGCVAWFLVLGSCTRCHAATLPRCTTLHYTHHTTSTLHALPAPSWNVEIDAESGTRSSTFVSFLRHPDTAWESLVALVDPKRAPKNRTTPLAAHAKEDPNSAPPNTIRALEKRQGGHGPAKKPSCQEGALLVRRHGLAARPAAIVRAASHPGQL